MKPFREFRENENNSNCVEFPVKSVYREHECKNIEICVKCTKIHTKHLLEVHHQLFTFPIADLEVVPLAPVHIVLNRSSVQSILSIGDEANGGRVISEFLQMTARQIVSKSAV